MRQIWRRSRRPNRWPNWFMHSLKISYGMTHVRIDNWTINAWKSLAIGTQIHSKLSIRDSSCIRAVIRIQYIVKDLREARKRQISIFGIFFQINFTLKFKSLYQNQQSSKPSNQHPITKITQNFWSADKFPNNPTRYFTTVYYPTDFSQSPL